MKKLRYSVKGMNCAACVAHVEHAIAKVCDHAEITVSLLTNSVTVAVDDSYREDELFEKMKRSLSASGYGLEKEEAAQRALSSEKQTKRALSTWLVSAGLTLLLMIVSMGHMTKISFLVTLSEQGFLFGLLQLALTLPVVILNFHFYRNGFFALFHRAPNMDSLIAIGSCASLLFGIYTVGMTAYVELTASAPPLHASFGHLYFDSAAMILTLVSLGKLLEGRAKANAARAIDALASMMPQIARVERNGTITEIPLGELAVGETVLVREGEIIPVDGTVLSGSGAVNESAITGESIPTEKSVGDTVTGVCTLISGHLRIRADHVGEDTALARIIRLIEEASASKAPIARIADRVSRVFVPVVLGISLLTALLWGVLTRDLHMALQCSVSVLVISCPCALGLATPTAIIVGISKGASRGILIKSSEALERLLSVRFFLTDKTGTLTAGRPTLTDCVPSERFVGNQSLLLSYAYGMESMSTHPLADAICKSAKEQKLSLPHVESYQSDHGKGICATVDGAPCRIGTQEYLRECGILLSEEEQKQLASLEEQGKSVVCLSVDGVFAAFFALADTLREESKRAIEALKARGITPVMLTGDNERTAKAIAAECGIDEYHARLLPHEKEAMLRQYAQKGPCAMVGDGINDAPALAAADVGIAIGAGTEVAIDSAQIILSRSSLEDAVTAIHLSELTLRCIKQNLFWALIYNAVCIPLAAGAFYPLFGIALSPMIGSGAMSISSLCVVTNSLRLRRIRLYPEIKKTRMRKRRAPLQKSKTSNQTKEEPNMLGSTKTISLSVQGMMCNNCKAHVEKALSEVKGVKSAAADLATKTVAVVAKSALKESALIDALRAAGYEATLL